MDAAERERTFADARAAGAKIDFHIFDVPVEELWHRLTHRAAAAGRGDYPMTLDELRWAASLFESPMADELRGVDKAPGRVGSAAGLMSGRDRHRSGLEARTALGHGIRARGGTDGGGELAAQVRLVAVAEIRSDVGPPHLLPPRDPLGRLDQAQPAQHPGR